MAKNRRPWTLEKEIRDRKRRLKSVNEDELLDDLTADLNSPSTVRDLASAPVSFLNAVLLYRGQVSIWDGDLSGWTDLHLAFRYKAFKWKVTLDRLVECYMPQDRTKAPRPDVVQIELMSANELLMIMANSLVLRDDAIGHYFGDRCTRMFADKEPLAEVGAFTQGSVEPFLLALYAKWRSLDVSVSFPDDAVPCFRSIIDNWHDSNVIKQSIEEICALRVQKITHLNDPDDDFVFGLQVPPYDLMPVEILFLQRIRSEMGLKSPEVNHELLQSPLVQIPKPFPVSGYDAVLADVYARCKSIMPSLVVPWEDEYLRQKLG